jgi:serine/threonine-protein kinase
VSDVTERLKKALADRYAVERELGSGGMATVHLARDQRYERQVAVKVLKPELAAAVGSDRFLREIKITAQLNHPHILPLLDSGEADGFLYYVMPYVDGGSLRSVLNRERPLRLDEAQRITQQAAAALDHAHRLGVIHRDLKPENILFSEGLVIVADFGIAKAVSSVSREKLTRSGFPLGTPGYMSPEQAAGRSGLDARTDVFGFACVVYEMLVGDTPEMWPTQDAVRVGRFLDASPQHRDRLDQLPGRLEQVLTRALAMRPSDRFATPGEFADALTAASEGTAKLSEGAVRDIIERAVELDASQSTAPLATEGGALSVGGVEQVAAQVGVPPDRVREAVRELEPPPGSPPADATALALVKPRFHKGRLTVDRTVPGEVPESEYEALVDEIQRALGFVGNVSGIGKALIWSGTKPGFVGRDTRVTVTRGEDHTRIHVEEHVEIRGPSMFAPAWGAAGGGMAGLGILAGLGLSDTAAIFLVIPMAVGGAILTVNGIVKGLARRYSPQLEALADRLASHVERAALPGRTGPSGGHTP